MVDQRTAAEPEVNLETTFAALADPARLEVIGLLSQQPRRSGDLAAALGVSPPALSRHLRILRRSGLVQEHGLEEDARVRIYELRKEPFDATADWLNEVNRYWSRQLSAFPSPVRRRRRK